MKFFNDFNKPGKGVKKESGKNKFGFGYFFFLIKEKIWKISILNLMFFGLNFPIFCLFAYLVPIGGEKFMTPAGIMFQPLHGVELIGQNHATFALRGIMGIQIGAAYPTALSYVFLGLGALLLLTFGVTNSAMTYIQRNYVMDKHTDLGHDFFSCIKNNFRQGVVIGIIDLFIVFVIAFDLVSYQNTTGAFIMLVFRYLTIFLSVMYLFMRPYLYLQIVTFDIKITKVIKNAWILSTAGLKRNIFCGLAAFAIVLFNYIAFAYLPPIGALLLFILTVSLAWFIQIYGAYPVMKKHMIDPFYEEKTVTHNDPEEAVFTDRG